MKASATRLTAILLFAILAVTGMMAQPQQRQPLSEDDRERFLTEMRNVKHDFMARELKLTRDQQNAFFPIYDSMEDEVARINAETRELEKSVADDEDATDTEIEAAARATFELKEREARVELEAYDKFKTVLNPRQLLRIKAVEKKFTQQLMREHRKKHAKR